MSTKGKGAPPARIPYGGGDKIDERLGRGPGKGDDSRVTDFRKFFDKRGDIDWGDHDPEDRDEVKQVQSEGNKTRITYDI